MEKKRKNTFDLHQRWEKMLMILRTIFLIVVITTINFETNASTQTNKVSVKMENATIDEIIKSVRTTTNYDFFIGLKKLINTGNETLIYRMYPLTNFSVLL